MNNINGNPISADAIKNLLIGMSPEELQKWNQQQSTSQSTIEENTKLSSLETLQKSSLSNGTQKVLVVSSRVDDKDTLLASALSGTIIVEYDWEASNLSDLLRSIKSQLNNEYASDIVFMDHGIAGSFELVKGENFSIQNTSTDIEQKQFLKSLGQLIGKDGNIYFPECDLAASEDGIKLLSVLSETTKKHVAASTNVTGNSLVGGDWLMETDGTDLAQKFFSSKISEWKGSLGITTLTDLGYVYQCTTDKAKLLAEEMCRLMAVLQKDAVTFVDTVGALITNSSDSRFQNILERAKELAIVTSQLFKSNILSGSSPEISNSDLGIASADWTNIKNWVTQIKNTLKPLTDLFNVTYDPAGIAAPTAVLKSTVQNADLTTALKNLMELGKGSGIYSADVQSLRNANTAIFEILTGLNLVKQIGDPNPLYTLQNYMYNTLTSIDSSLGNIGNEMARRSEALQPLSELDTILTANFKTDPFGSITGYIGHTTTTAQTQVSEAEYTFLGQARSVSSDKVIVTSSNNTMKISLRYDERVYFSGDNSEVAYADPGGFANSKKTNYPMTVTLSFTPGEYSRDAFAKLIEKTFLETFNPKFDGEPYMSDSYRTSAFSIEYDSSKNPAEMSLKWNYPLKDLKVKVNANDEASSTGAYWHHMDITQLSFQSSPLVSAMNIGTGIYTENTIHTIKQAVPTQIDLHYGLAKGIETGVIILDKPEENQALWNLHAMSADYVEFVVPASFNGKAFSDLTENEIDLAIRANVFTTTSHPLWSLYGADSKKLFKEEILRFNSDRTDIHLSGLTTGEVLRIPIRKTSAASLKPAYSSAIQPSQLDRLYNSLIDLKNKKTFITGNTYEDQKVLEKLDSLIAGLAAALNPTPAGSVDALTNGTYSLYSSKEDSSQVTDSATISNANRIKTWYKELYNVTGWWEGLQKDSKGQMEANKTSALQTTRELISGLSSLNDGLLSEMRQQLETYQNTISLNKTIIDKFKELIKMLTQKISS